MPYKVGGTLLPRFDPQTTPNLARIVRRRDDDDADADDNTNTGHYRLRAGVVEPDAAKIWFAILRVRSNDDSLDLIHSTEMAKRPPRDHSDDVPMPTLTIDETASSRHHFTTEVVKAAVRRLREAT